MTDAAGAMVRLHSSTVAFPRGDEWAALVILGRSGAGKSELALSLVAMGASLVADDQTEFFRDGPMVRAKAPASLRGLIELRGMGLLQATAVEATVCAVVDLDQAEHDRMPPLRSFPLLGVDLPLFHRIDSMAFAAGLRQYMLSAPDLRQGQRETAKDDG